MKNRSYPIVNGVPFAFGGGLLVGGEGEWFVFFEFLENGRGIYYNEGRRCFMFFGNLKIFLK